MAPCVLDLSGHLTCTVFKKKPKGFAALRENILTSVDQIINQSINLLQ
jgi:hypothetical protein